MDQRQSSLHTVAGLALAALLSTGGCKQWLPPAFSLRAQQQADEKGRATPGADSAASTDESSEIEQALRDEGWFLSAKSAAEDDDASLVRWRHERWDRLLASGKTERRRLLETLSDKSAVVSANAAIALARLEDDHAREPLDRAIRDASLKLSVRRASAEALGRMTNSQDSPRLLRKLVDDFGDYSAEGHVAYLPELHEELLRALSRFDDNLDEPRYESALASPSPAVRRQALARWLPRHRELPPRVEDLCTDADASVRARAILIVAAHRHPRGVELAQAGLRDYELSVRLASIEALGLLADPVATARLRELLSHDSELIRAAAVKSLGVQGRIDLARPAVDDRSWRVRVELAAVLARFAGQEQTSIARRLLEDRQGDVQRQMLTSLEAWPLELAVGLLLTGVEQQAVKTRRQALLQLASRYPPAKPLPDLTEPEQQALLTQLRSDWEQSSPSPPAEQPTQGPPRASDGESAVVADARDVARLRWILDRMDTVVNLSPKARSEAAEQLRAFGPDLLPLLDTMAEQDDLQLPTFVYREVLAPLDESFALVEQLTTADLALRRQAARQLEQRAAQTVLGRLALARMAALGEREPDTLVYQSLLAAVQNDGRENALRLATSALGHPRPEPRRLACEYLRAHPAEGHDRWLVPLLDDPNHSVQLAAIRALGRQPAVVQTGKLEALLAARDKRLRLAAAASLARLKQPVGQEALLRLAHDDDAEIRRLVAVEIGQQPDERFLPTLIEMLDDPTQVRHAALVSLRQFTGDADAPTRPVTPVLEQVAAWKAWWQRRQPATP